MDPIYNVIRPPGRCTDPDVTMCQFLHKNKMTWEEWEQLRQQDHNLMALEMIMEQLEKQAKKTSEKV